MENTEQNLDNQETPEASSEGQVDLTEEAKIDENQAQDVSLKPSVSEGEMSEEPEFDVKKSYNELRREFTRRTQEEAKLRKQYQEALDRINQLESAYMSLIEGYNESQKTPTVTPDQFLLELQQKGVDALDPYLDVKLQSRLKAWQDKYEAALHELSTKSYAIEAHLETLKRLNDKKNYPDFDTLLPTIKSIIEDPNCPIDFTKLTIPAIFDAAYKLAKAMHSDSAVKEAVNMEAKKVEQKLAKESATTVAGGGKARAPINPDEITDIKELRKFFVARLGESE